MKGGLENYAFSHAPYTVQTSYQVRPRAEFSLTWMRHICENSNYTINVFARMKQPQMQEVNPLYGNTFLKPNAELKAEKEILIESHLYRKFDDNFYISASDIFYNQFDQNRIKDKIVLIGSSAQGIFDLIKTPSDKIIPGVEVHATIIENIFQTFRDTYLKNIPQ